jgi:hypothetical protein
LSAPEVQLGLVGAGQVDELLPVVRHVQAEKFLTVRMAIANRA